MIVDELDNSVDEKGISVAEENGLGDEHESDGGWDESVDASVDELDGSWDVSVDELDGTASSTMPRHSLTS